MDDFKVSVIIPIYNVAEYVEVAVESTISLPEVGEVILIDDGSPDNSIGICKELQKKHQKVKVFQHPEGLNKGVSASRNLGIDEAQFPFIAFLDADDWYLPHRFKKDKIIFEKYTYADAVYSCSVLEENIGRQNKRYGVTVNPFPLWGYPRTPMEFYKKKIQHKAVLFNTNSITFKADFLKKDKCFDERLKLHEDTELWNRLMRRGFFFAAEWEKPVAVIRRHVKNTITARNRYSQLKMLAVQIDNIGLDNLEKFEISEFYSQICREKSKKFKSHWARRMTFYSAYYLNWFQMRIILTKLMNSYA